MNLKQLKERLTEYADKYPELKDNMKEIYALAYAEVEQGGSEPHECELAINAIEEYIEEVGL